jgi:hypothetical protein
MCWQNLFYKHCCCVGLVDEDLETMYSESILTLASLESHQARALHDDKVCEQHNIVDVIVAQIERFVL